MPCPSARAHRRDGTQPAAEALGPGEMVGDAAGADGGAGTAGDAPGDAEAAGEAAGDGAGVIAGIGGVDGMGPLIFG